MNEKEAIEGIKRLIKWFEKWDDDYTLVPCDKVYFETVLNLIEKQDKIIDYMAEEIASYNHYEALGKLEDKDCVKQYFNQKIKKGE